MKYGQLAIWIMAAIFAMFFGTYIWPTKYAYYVPNVQNGMSAQIIRVNRFTGDAQAWNGLLGDHWYPLPVDKNPVRAGPMSPSLQSQ